MRTTSLHHRKAFLTVTGPGFVWTVEVPAADTETARKFAAELSTYGAQQAARNRG